MGTAQAKKNRGSFKGCRGLSEEVTGSEEETEANLNLAAGVGKIAVGIGDAAEWRVERQCRSYKLCCRIGGAPDAISGVVDAGYVLMVEEIERLAENLGTVTVAEANFLGEAQVHVDSALHLEGIAADDVDALATIGTVHPPTERLGANCGDVARDRVSGNERFALFSGHLRHAAMYYSQHSEKVVAFWPKSSECDQV